ncbi:MAG: hypothetical protein HY364_00490 [Candidatus Aenigmarchaeota archaeon]|nr:hypothetical protein [Candidatus Aenigmarchaeota archaeon]
MTAKKGVSSLVMELMPVLILFLVGAAIVIMVLSGALDKSNFLAAIGIPF